MIIEDLFKAARRITMIQSIPGYSTMNKIFGLVINTKEMIIVADLEIVERMLKRGDAYSSAMAVDTFDPYIRKFYKRDGWSFSYAPDFILSSKFADIRHNKTNENIKNYIIDHKKELITYRIRVKTEIISGENDDQKSFFQHYRANSKCQPGYLIAENATHIQIAFVDTEIFGMEGFLEIFAKSDYEIFHEESDPEKFIF